jgi:hypothetical protein
MAVIHRLPTATERRFMLPTNNPYIAAAHKSLAGEPGRY